MKQRNFETDPYLRTTPIHIGTTTFSTWKKKTRFQRQYLFCSKWCSLEKLTCFMMTPFFKKMPFGFNLGRRVWNPIPLSMYIIIDMCINTWPQPHLTTSFSCSPKNQSCKISVAQASHHVYACCEALSIMIAPTYAGIKTARNWCLGPTAPVTG